MNETPPPKNSPHLTPALLSAIAGALVMWWGLTDRMEKSVTEKVNLTSRVAQLGERIEGLRSDLTNLRAELNTLRNQQPQPSKP